MPREIGLPNPPFSLAPFVGRTGFSQLLVDKGLMGYAVEVGVHQGAFSQQFLSRWRGKHWWGIDLWQPPPQQYPDHYSNPQPSRDQDMALAQKAIARFANRAKLVRTSSVAAAKVLPNNLDFVYLDACHYREPFRQDCLAWWPKIKPGGILAGHDIEYMPDDSSLYRWRAQIEPVLVDMFSTIYVVSEPRRPWSWYVEKT